MTGDRVLDANQLAAGEGRVCDIIWFGRFDFTTGEVRAHIASGTIPDWAGGDPWLGVGNFGGIDSVKDSANGVSQNVVATLSGFDRELLGNINAASQRGRLAEFYRGTVDRATRQLIGVPRGPWIGAIDRIALRFGERTAAISVFCESTTYRSNRSTAAATSPEDQRSRFSDDSFFDYQAQLDTKTFNWGGEDVVPQIGGAGPGTSIDLDVPINTQLP